MRSLRDTPIARSVSEAQVRKVRARLRRMKAREGGGDTMRAKFKVTKVDATMQAFLKDSTKGWNEPGNSVQREIQTVHLSAVTDDANKTWSQYTPSGSLQLSISNPDAVGFLKLGECYFLDFTPAPAKEADEAK